MCVGCTVTHPRMCPLANNLEKTLGFPLLPKTCTHFSPNFALGGIWICVLGNKYYSSFLPPNYLSRIVYFVSDCVCDCVAFYLLPNLLLLSFGCNRCLSCNCCINRLASGRSCKRSSRSLPSELESDSSQLA